MVANCEPSPFCTVHLSLNGADSRKARCAQKVEDQERICGQRRKGGLHIGPDLPAVLSNLIKAAIEYAKGANDVFLRNQAGNRRNRSLPVAPAQRSEDPGNGIADDRQNTAADFNLAEASVCKSVV